MARGRGRKARGRRALVVGVLAAVFLNVSIIVGPVTAANAAQLTPTDDSYVDSNRTDKVFGARRSLRVDGSPQRVAYLKFDVQGVGTPASASLQIYAETSGDDLVLYAVADTTWDEATLTFNNAPPLGAIIESIDGIVGGVSYYFDVSSYITGDGVYSFGLATTDNTAIRLGAKEGNNGAQLHIPAPSSPSPFLVTRFGSVYTAASQSTTSSYTGTLKDVVESAVFELGTFSGGTVTFAADTFDLGSEHFEFNDIEDIIFEGQGIASTIITNNTNANADTEPFDVVTANRVTVRDMTISANGSARTTSDAIDFDNGNDITIERVSITASRGSGIIFDGKGAGWTALRNRVIDCQIDGIPGDGIELLASSNNTISGCTITDVGGHGIQINKSSSVATQPNKKSNDNLITGNAIDGAGLDGININSSDRNRIINNIVFNSSDNVSNKDGIRILSISGISCDDNEIEGNTATDNQAVKTQRYGINISDAECNRTVIGVNSLAGNKTGEINDNGTDTQYNLPPDATPPSVPTGVTAGALSHFEVDVAWSASTDDVGVSGYTVYRDANAIATVGGSVLSYSDVTVSPATTYDYTVEAFDVAGNLSGQSSPPAQVTTPSPSATITVNPSDDAYVDSSRPDNNYGSSTALRVDGSPLKNAYLKFDVIGITGTVISATIRIYAATGSSVGLDLSEVADTGWTEGAITYNSAPAIGALLGSSGSFSGGNYQEIDVTAYVTGDGLLSFAVTTPHTTAIRFDSSEGGNPPELVIVQGS